MKSMRVSIERVFDCDSYPGRAECTLVDAFGKAHVFSDKIPIFTNAMIDGYSVFPQEGSIRCEVVREWTDDSGQILVTVNTGYPDDVESAEGLVEFTVWSSCIL